jgi:hypothetical protein
MVSSMPLHYGFRKLRPQSVLSLHPCNTNNYVFVSVKSIIHIMGRLKLKLALISKLLTIGVQTLTFWPAIQQPPSPPN